MLKKLIGSWKTYLNEYRPTLRRAHEFYVNSQDLDLFLQTGLSATIVMSFIKQHKNIEKNRRHFWENYLAESQKNRAWENYLAESDN